MIVWHVNLNLREVLPAFKSLHRCRFDVLILLLDHLENRTRSHVVSPILVVPLRHLELVEGRLDVDSVAGRYVLDDLIPACPLRLSQYMLGSLLDNISRDVFAHV